MELREKNGGRSMTPARNCSWSSVRTTPGTFLDKQHPRGTRDLVREDKLLSGKEIGDAGISAATASRRSKPRRHLRHADRPHGLGNLGLGLAWTRRASVPAIILSF